MICTALRFTLAASLASGVAACHGGHGAGNVPGDSQSHAPYAGIGEGETVHFTGTEPFWGGTVKGTVLTYQTPEKPEGVTATVARFAGRNGVSYTGKLEGEDFTLAVTPGACSDGMSDRTFPFTATLRLTAGALRSGCAWTDGKPFAGPAKP